MHRGYVHQWRKELESEVFKDPDHLLYKVWCWCKMKANWKSGLFRGLVIAPGQFVISVGTAADSLEISRASLIRRLDRLEEMGNIMRSVHHHRTVITLTNWKIYAQKGEPSGLSSDTPRTVSDTFVGLSSDTIKEGEALEAREPGNGEAFEKPPTPGRRMATVLIPPELESPEFREQWENWEAHHREKGKPLTSGVRRELIERLFEMGKVRAIRAIKYSISNNYTGLVEPDAEKNGAPTRAEDDARHAQTAAIIARQNEKAAAIQKQQPPEMKP